MTLNTVISFGDKKEEKEEKEKIVETFQDLIGEIIKEHELLDEKAIDNKLPELETVTKYQRYDNKGNQLSFPFFTSNMEKNITISGIGYEHDDKEKEKAWNLKLVFIPKVNSSDSDRSYIKIGKIEFTKANLFDLYNQFDQIFELFGPTQEELDKKKYNDDLLNGKFRYIKDKLIEFKYPILHEEKRVVLGPIGFDSSGKEKKWDLILIEVFKGQNIMKIGNCTFSKVELYLLFKTFDRLMRLF